MIKKACYIALLMLSLTCFANAQQQLSVSQTTNFTATGSSAVQNMLGRGLTRYKLQWWALGTVSTCSVKVEVSADNSSWSDLIAAQTCTSDNVARTATEVSAHYVRVTLGTLSGGGVLQARLDSYDPVVLSSSAGGAADWATITGGTSTEDFLIGTGGSFGVTGSGTIESTTAVALFTNPTNCSAGSYPLGIAASGNVEDCTVAATGTLSGTLAATRIPFASDATTLTDSANLTFSSADNTLAVTGKAMQSLPIFSVASVGATVPSMFAEMPTNSVNVVPDDSVWAEVWTAESDTAGHFTGIVRSEDSFNISSTDDAFTTISKLTLNDGGSGNLGSDNGGLEWANTGILNFSAGFQVAGAATTVTKILSGTAVLDFGNLAAIGCADLTISVPGAVDGDQVIVSAPVAAYVSATSTFSGFVSAADVATVRYCALVSGDPPSETFRATVLGF